MNTKWIIATVVAVVTFGTMGQQATAGIVINGVAYSAGMSESLTAPFTTPDAAITRNLYSSYVEVAISGVGYSYGPALNDAFYSYTEMNGNPITPTNNAAGFFQLGFDTKALTPSDTSRDAINFIAYDVTAGIQVNPGYVPSYQANHSYNIVIKIDSTTSAQLHFGVVDSLFSDNGGTYSLTVTQLVGVPEPSSLLMLGIGVAGMIGYRWRRTKKQKGSGAEKQ